MMTNNAFKMVKNTNNTVLDDIAEGYIRRIQSVLAKLKYKTVVLDFDGTLTEFRYSFNSLLPCKDGEELNDYLIYNNMYASTYMLRTMKYIISELKTEDIYVISKAVENARNYKTYLILSNFDNIPENNILYVNDTDEKIELLQKIYNKHGQDIIFVEDTADTLIKAEEAFPFVKGIHISSLIY